MSRKIRTGRYTVAAFLHHHPNTMLAEHIKNKGLHPRKEIIVDSGIVAPETPQSKIFQIMRNTGWKNYLTGGRADKNRTAGHWFCVYK